MQQENEFEVIIVGGSYAGLAAAMALGRALRKVMVIDAGQPCNQPTPYSHNFLTQDGKPPAEIARLARQQVERYDTIRFLNGFAVSGIKAINGFHLQTAYGETFIARKLIFATGIKDIMPDIPGFAACWGKSVLHCPYCHGYEVRHQKTGILANGDTAFDLTSLISNWTSDLVLFTNGISTLSESQKIKLRQHRIPIIENEIKEFIHRDGYIQNILFSDGREEPVKAIYSRPPFVQHSSIPQSLGCEITSEGYISIDMTHKTSIPGVFACGDNTTRMRTVANAVSMGTAAGLMVNKELIEDDF